MNIGKTKVVPPERAVADYVASARLVAPVASYVVVNVSSPNTPGLRDLQATSTLRPLLTAVRAALDEADTGRRVPLLVKIAPDLADGDVDAIADLALELGLDGIIATNTTIGRSGLVSDPALVAAAGAGGLSGAPLRARSLEVLGRLYAPDRGPAGADRGGRDRDRGRRLGAHRGRGHADPGLHRVHLRRPGLAAPRAGRAGPPGPGGRADLDRAGPGHLGPHGRLRRGGGAAGARRGRQRRGGIRLTDPRDNPICARLRPPYVPWQVS